jgi:hypothetical protein
MSDNELIAEFMGWRYIQTEHDRFWRTGIFVITFPVLYPVVLCLTKRKKYEKSVCSGFIVSGGSWLKRAKSAWQFP